MYRQDSLEEHADYSLAFIELDDQGELWAPSQLERTLAHLQRLNQNPSGVALVLFIHGWNTDASPREEREGKGTLYQYRAILTRLAEGLHQEFPQIEVPVMGIYMSWRGRVTSVPILREASFYNRRGAAERISGAPATEAIYRILTTLRENPASRSVLFGHSFGSKILERALAQAVVSALLAVDDRQLVFPADLVVLLNPAGSASQSKQLIDILARNRIKTYRFDQDGNRFERPLLVSFTSESDRATRSYFPLGMRVKAMSKKFREYGQEYCSAISNQRELYTHTAGNLPALYSHEVTVGPKSEGGAEQRPSDRMIPEFLGYRESYDPSTQQMVFSFDGEENRFTIRRKPRALNDTPYWIARVPRELIPNHSEVLTENAFRLIEAVLILSATYDADVQTIVEREDGVRPVAVVPLPDGAALFVDRGRGVYAVEPGSARPVFLTCLQEAIDPSDAIGFFVAGHLAYATLSTPQGGAADRRCSTDFYEFQVDDTGYKQLSFKQLAGNLCFRAATFDLTRKRMLLSYEGETGAEIWMADLTEDAPRASRLFEIPTGPAPRPIYFDASGERLFAAQGESGALWEIDTATDPAVFTRIDRRKLGWPMALAVSKITQHLYVTDGKQQRIWELDCKNDCGEPMVFLDSDALQAPSTLAVGLDGTVWLGDLSEQSLTAISSDGTVRTTIRALGGSR